MKVLMNQKVIVLSGGISEERDVSLVSSKEIATGLAARGYVVAMVDPAEFSNYTDMITEIKSQNPYIVFNGLHGAAGEDGRIQALLELEKIPFTGSGFHACALAMDKVSSKLLAKEVGVAVPEYKIFKSVDSEAIMQVIKSFGFPLVIKPNSSGSSCGVSIIEEADQLIPAVELALQYGNLVLIEKYIEGRELTVTILEDIPLPVVEITPIDGWYDYHHKYKKGNSIYEVPAKLKVSEIEKIQKKALAIHRILGCQAYSRVDFRYDSKEFYYLESNTLPGMTPLSLTPMAAKAAGIQFNELLERIIQSSMQRKSQ
jgi:D-alanine-D-alanine ligase